MESEIKNQLANKLTKYKIFLHGGQQQQKEKILGITVKQEEMQQESQAGEILELAKEMKNSALVLHDGLLSDNPILEKILNQQQQSTTKLTREMRNIKQINAKVSWFQSFKTLIIVCFSLVLFFIMLNMIFWFPSTRYLAIPRHEDLQFTNFSNKMMQKVNLKLPKRIKNNKNLRLQKDLKTSKVQSITKTPQNVLDGPELGVYTPNSRIRFHQSKVNERNVKYLDKNTQKGKISSDRLSEIVTSTLEKLNLDSDEGIQQLLVKELSTALVKSKQRSPKVQPVKKKIQPKYIKSTIQSRAHSRKTSPQNFEVGQKRKGILKQGKMPQKLDTRKHKEVNQIKVFKFPAQSRNSPKYRKTRKTHKKFFSNTAAPSPLQQSKHSRVISKDESLISSFKQSDDEILLNMQLPYAPIGPIREQFDLKDESGIFQQQDSKIREYFQENTAALRQRLNHLQQRLEKTKLSKYSLDQSLAEEAAIKIQRWFRRIMQEQDLTSSWDNMLQNYDRKVFQSELVEQFRSSLSHHYSHMECKFLKNEQLLRLQLEELGSQAEESLLKTGNSSESSKPVTDKYRMQNTSNNLSAELTANQNQKSNGFILDIENLPSSIDFGHEEVVEKNNLRGETGGSASRESSDKESLDELIPESDQSNIAISEASVSFYSFRIDKDEIAMKSWSCLTKPLVLPIVYLLQKEDAKSSSGSESLDRYLNYFDIENNQSIDSDDSSFWTPLLERQNIKINLNIPGKLTQPEIKDEDLNQIISLEVQAYLEKTFNNFSKVDYSDQFIVSFIENIVELVRGEEELFLDIFNSPLIQDPLQKLETLQDAEIGGMPRIPVIELILLPDLKKKLKRIYNCNIKQKPLANIHKRSRQASQQNPKSTFASYIRCLFFATNEALNRTRPYGLDGEPLPWSKKARVLLGDEDLEVIFQKALDLVTSWTQVRKNPFPFHNIILPNDSLDLQKKSTKDNWISKVLYEDIYGEDENWMDFEDEEVQCTLDSADMVLENLLDECLSILNMGKVV